MARARDMYYVDGSTVRKVEVPAPERVKRPVRTKKTKTYRKAAVKAENSLGFDMGYMIVLSVMLILMIASCVVMLSVQGNIETKESNIESLQRELESVQADNDAFEDSLNNMYSLDDIYKVATSELGMVYSQNGQIIRYDKQEDDYVKQYSDVPKTVD
ncbi:Septum formation initiator [Lachnospiraceae bacterium]|nr:Septum formation initiator [Lachnospiraceae bacterium]